MNKKVYWFNYAEEKYEFIDTPASFESYIPQSQAAQGLYSVYIKMGDEPLVAAAKVLSACVGEKYEVAK